MTLIFAHRGYSKEYPENTMRSFGMAEQFGADGIELDVHLCNDNIPVVIHDETVNRTTNGRGFIRDFTIEELKRMKIRNGQNEQIPTLEEVLRWICTTNLFVNIELKTDKIRYFGIENIVLELITKYNLLDRVVISSFNSDSLFKVHQICRTIETAYLYDFYFDNPYVLAQMTGASSLHPKSSTIRSEMIDACQKRGIPIRPYTVNKVDDMKRLFQVNSAGIITDNPPLAYKIRSEIQKW